MDLLTGTEFLGNELRQWLVSVAIIIMTVLAAKIVYWVFASVVRKSASVSRLDDTLVSMMEEPVVFSLILMGVWYGLHTLTLSASAERWLITGYYFLIIITIAWVMTRFVDALITEYLVPLAERAEEEWHGRLLSIVRKGFRITIWFIALILSLNNAGYDMGALLVGLGIGGLAFALAAQDSVANLFGGITIFADRPFALRDRVMLDGYDGVVEEIGIRSVRIRTLDGRLVTIPNKRVAEHVVVNISSEPGRRVTLTIGLTCGMDHGRVRQALALLETIARNTEGVDPDRITTVFGGDGDFSLTVRLIYWILKGADVCAVQTALNLKILEEFAACGLEMAFPPQAGYVTPSGAAGN